VIVRLITYSHILNDPRRLVLLGIKTSSGSVREKGINHYISEYPSNKLSKVIIEAGKYPSVLEHIVFTFYIDGISRVTSHQLVRHRLASYTQESQRYSAVSREYVIPDSVIKAGFKEKFEEIINKCFQLYDEMVSSGVPYEDARYVLPQAATTRLIMTVNLRELLHIACLRMSEEAQWEIRELVIKMVSEVSKVLPEVNELLKLTCPKRDGYGG